MKTVYWLLAVVLVSTAAFAEVTLNPSVVGNPTTTNAALDAKQDAATAATDTELDLKAPLASPTFTGTVSGVTKTHVGLGNADNTSDVSKPVSTAQQTALDLKLNSADFGFTDWTSYTPVVTSESGGWTNYTATGRYRIVAKMLTVSFRVIFSDTSAAASGLYISLPSGLTMNASVMTGGASWDTDLVGFGILGDSGTISGVPAIINTRTTQKVLVKYYNTVAASYLTAPGLSNTAPWTWTWQDTVDGQFTVPIT